MKKLTNRVVSEEQSASARHVEKTEESVVGIAANVRDVIVGIQYLIWNALTAVMTPSHDDGKPYGNIRIASMMQAMVYKTVSAKCESVEFEIHLHQTPENFVLSSKSLIKVAEALLGSDEFLEPIAHVVKAEAGRVSEVSLRREDHLKRFVLSTEKPLSARFSLRN